MSFSLLSFLGPALAFLTFFLFAKGIVKRAKGRDFNPLPVFGLFLAAVAVPFLQSNEVLASAYPFINYKTTFLDRLTVELLNFGLGMAINSVYLMWKKESPKLFLVPGIFALVLSAALHFLSGLINTVSGAFADDMRANPATVELLMELGPDDYICDVKHILKYYGADYERTFDEVTLAEDADLAQYYTIYVDSALMPALMQELIADQSDVDNVERNPRVHLIEPTRNNATITPNAGNGLANDPYLANEWFAASLNYNDVYAILQANKPQRKARIAIVDTGVDGVHEDLGNVFKGGKATTDIHGHGTHCAGLAGAATNNGTGMASLNWGGEFVEIRGYAALSSNGSGTARSIAKAIVQAAEDGADVISLSLGGYAPRAPKAEVDAIEYARSLGAIVVVAAGNSSDDARLYAPANIPGVLVVSAIDQSGAKASFSNTNTSLPMPIAAPGTDIFSLQPNNRYMPMSGTSMSAPIVAGLVGILRAYRPDISAAEAYRILNESGTVGADASTTGRTIQPAAALKQVVQLP